MKFSTSKFAAALCLSSSITLLAGPKVSIIGDSYSTYQSWGATYYPSLDVRDISQQWWSQVIAGIDGASLEENASWSGARMSGLDTDGGATTFSSFLCRARLIGNPDVIFICGAMNDDWNGVSTSVLERDVELMFNDLDRNHPSAKKFFVLNAENAGGRPGLKPATRECILALCARHYYPVVDLNGVLTVGSADYQSDHPTAQGMTKIANATLAKYADCETNGYPARSDAAATVQADGLFTADDTTYTCEMVGDEYVVTFTNITHAITFTPLVPIDISRILVVGGGGAGGFTIGGGGGGGQVRDLDLSGLGLDVDESATIIVGQGGYEPLTKAKDAGETDNKCTWWYNHGEGGASSITLAGTTYAALGGGAGGSWRAEKGSDGANGGGGAGTKDEPREGGASVNGGHAGGDVYAVGDFKNRAPGGGGGAGGNGQTPASATAAGDGGAGVSSDITGVTQIYGAGGGGGIGNSTTTPGVGGTNAGNGAPTKSAKGGSAVDGFGGGGGGGGYDGSLGYAGGNGGNGTVIIRFSESVVEQTPAPRVGFRGVTATDHTSATYSWRFVSKGDIPEGATLVACDVYGVCSNAMVRPMTNRLATVDSTVPAVYSAVFAHLAPGTTYDGAVFAVSRYALAGGETAEYVSEAKTFTFTTVAEQLDRGVTELAYLESTGTQYIKTGITPSADLRIAGKYEVLPAVSLTGGGWVTIFGYFSSASDGLCLWHNPSNQNLMFNRPSLLKTEAIAVGRTYEFETSGASMTVNGVEYASSAAYSCSQTPDMPLFAFYAPAQGGYTTSSSHVRLYGFKIWKGDELVRDFVPAQDASGAVGMYDLVSERFFKNDGTGVFNAGDAVEAGRLAKSFALVGETYDGGTLVASLSQRGGAAGDVMMCAGAEYGGDDLSAWTETRLVGAFGEGENALTAVMTDLPAGAVYVRFYSAAEKAWSPTIYLPGTEIASTPAPIVTDPVVKSVTPGLARFTTCVAFLGTGATSCDVFSVCTLDGVVVTNEVARNVTDSSELAFTLSPLRPGHDYAVRCFADNGAEGGVAASQEVCFTTPAENLGNIAYTEVEYLESSGTQYIKTGIAPSANLRLAGKYGHLAQGTLTGGKWVTIFGYFKSTSDSLCLWTNGENGWKLNFNRPSILGTKAMTAGNVYEFETSGASMTVDGTLYPSSATHACSWSGDLPLFAFYAPNNGGYTTCDSKVRLYSFKIWDGETLVRDFVPVIRNSTGKAGLYDLVSGMFFGNDGTGDFLYGRTVAEPRITSSLAVTDLVYDGSTLALTLTRDGAVAGEVVACFGEEYGGDQTNGWAHCVSAGRFAAGETAAELLVNGVGAEDAYVRFFSVADNAWSPSVIMADVEMAERMPPALSRPTASVVGIGSATFSVPLDYLGTGGSRCDVFSVLAAGGEARTNLVAQGVASCSVLDFTLAPLRPGCVYTLGCFATNDVGAVGESETVAFTAAELGECSPVPLDISEVEYLESSGGQYILTGVHPAANLRIAGKVEYLQQSGLTDNKWTTFFGYFSSTSDGFCLWVDDGTKKFNFNDPAILNGPVCTPGTVLEFETSGNQLTANGQTYLPSPSVAYNCSKSPDLPLFAFYAPNNGGYVTCKSRARIYSFRIYAGDELIRDFRPVIDADGVACLYDAVEGEYHRNAGTGSFIAGPVRTGAFVISGEPDVFGSAHPVYGAHYNVADGATFECAAPATCTVGTMTATCTGWQLHELGANGEWTEIGCGSGNVTVCTHSAAASRRLVWQFAVRDAAAVDAPAVKSVGVGGAAFDIDVCGIGLTAESATLSIAYGYSAESLVSTNRVAEGIDNRGTFHAVVNGLLPGRTYVVKAILENSEGEVAESAATGFVTAALPASEQLPEGYAKLAFLESDGGQRIDTGVSPGIDTAVEFDFHTLAYKNDTTFFGCEQWNGRQYLFIEQNANGGPWFRFYDEQKNIAAFEADTDYSLSLAFGDTAVLKSGNVIVANVPSLDFSIRNANAHLNLFDVNAGGHGGAYRLYGMRIVKGGELVRDFVPAIRAADGAAGLCDLLDGTFYTTATSKPFPVTAGRAIFSSEATEDGITLTFAASAVAAELFCASGVDYGADDAAEWTAFESIGTIGADETTKTVAYPTGWGESAFYAKYFTVAGGVTNWGPIAVWRDPSLPAIESVSADGFGGDKLTVTGTLDAFAGENCELKVCVGTDPNALDAVWEGLPGSTVAAAGDFAFTLYEPDAVSARAIRPDTTYYLAVEAVADGRAARSETVAVTTRGVSVIGTATSAVNRHTVTFQGELLKLGACGSASVTLWCGDANNAEAMQKAEGPITVTSTDAFSLTHDFGDFERTHYWQFRVVNVTAGGTDIETRSAVQSVKTQDSTTYTWRADVAEGDWCVASNWTDNAGGDCLGYPQTESATAVFPAGARATVTLSRALTVNKVDLGAAGLDLVFTGGKANRLTTPNLVLGTLEDGALRNSRIVIDNAAITAKSNHMYLGNGSELTFRNGADFLAEQSLYTQLDLRANPSIVVTNRVNVLSGSTFKTQNGIGLSGGTVFTVDDATLTFKNIYFNEHIGGGWLRIAGRHPVVTGSDVFRTAGNAADNRVGGLVFSVPARGYDEIPLTYTSNTERRFGGASEGSQYEPLTVNIDPDSPVYSHGAEGVHTYALVKCTKAIAVEKIDFGSLERRKRQPGTFRYSRTTTPTWEDAQGFTENDKPLMIGVTLETRPFTLIGVK